MILEEITSLLQAEDIGTTEGSSPTLMFNGLTDLPDTQTAVWEYGGGAPAHVKGQQAPILEYPRVQIVTRAKSYLAVRDKAERIYRLLDGFSGKIDGVTYAQIRALQQPFFLSRDDKNRFLIVCNYSITKELSPLA